VKELKEGWAGAMDAVESLERSEEILVTRTQNNNAARIVWSNDISFKCDIDQDFRDMCHKSRIPGTAEIVGDLESMRMKLASVDPTTIKEERKSGGQNGRRRAKISNTHMGVILEDSKDFGR
jgi:transcription initiation factor TFIIE subunit beta